METKKAPLIRTIFGMMINPAGVLKNVLKRTKWYFSIVLGCNTSIAFGVTGVLWAIGPMMYTIRELTGGNHRLSIPISSLVGVIVLLSWSTLGRF